MASKLGESYLLDEREPYTRGRSLHLLNSLTSFKFESKKTTLENILTFEEAIDLCEKASGDLVHDDLRIPIIRPAGRPVASTHVDKHYTQDSKTTYPTLRQFPWSYEQNTCGATTDLINSGKHHGGQADMGVGRVKGKRKGWQRKRVEEEGMEEEKAKAMESPTTAATTTTTTNEKEKEATAQTLAIIVENLAIMSPRVGRSSAT